MDKVFLIILIISGDSTAYRTREHPMPSWEVCVEAIEKARVERGYKTETNTVMYCVSDDD